MPEFIQHDHGGGVGAADPETVRCGEAFLPNSASSRAATLNLNEEEEAAHASATGALRVQVLRSVPELESIRDAWTRWNCHPNSDIDVYRMLMDCKPDFLRPHVITVGKDGMREALLVGRIVRQRVEFKIGYKTILSPNVRALNIIQGGTLGNFTLENSKLLLQEVFDSLGRGEADMR